MQPSCLVHWLRVTSGSEHLLAPRWAALQCACTQPMRMQRRYGYAVVALVGLGLYAAATISRVEDVHREGRKPK